MLRLLQVIYRSFICRMEKFGKKNNSTSNLTPKQKIYAKFIQFLEIEFLITVDETNAREIRKITSFKKIP